MDTMTEKKFLEEAMKCAERNDFSTGIIVLERAIKEIPNSSIIIFNLGDMYRAYAQYLYCQKILSRYMMINEEIMSEARHLITDDILEKALKANHYFVEYVNKEPVLSTLEGSMATFLNNIWYLMEENDFTTYSQAEQQGRGSMAILFGLMKKYYV